VDDWLVYVSGGVAASRFELDTDITSGGSDGLLGWTVGAGAEYLVGDIIGVKVEYRYLQFGDFNDGFEDSSGADIDVNMHVVMAGINFHF
jgi:outer membrane immunogenic protein